MKRRQFLKTTAATAAGTTILGRATAATYDEQPDHVTLTFDRTLLERYRPRLVLRNVDIEPDALYGWIATSSEYRYDWYCYICYYPFQDGVSDQDSHYPDREPYYVAVDPSTGEVARAVYDQYHYLVGATPAPATDDGSHPLARVIPPWHPYQPTTEIGQLVEVQDLHDRYLDWLAAGWAVHEPAVVDPPTVQVRGHWWSDDELSLLAMAKLSSTWLQFNQQTPFDVPLPGRVT